MLTLTLPMRAESFAVAFPDAADAGAALVWRGERLTATWLGGQDYRNKSRLYGAFPPYLLPRVFAMYPDARSVLHLFSGGLTRAHVDEVRAAQHVRGRLDWCGRCLLVHEVGSHGFRADERDYDPPHQARLDDGLHPVASASKPDVVSSADDEAGLRLTTRDDGDLHDLVVADPPYSREDAIRYWFESMTSVQHPVLGCRWRDSSQDRTCGCACRGVEFRYVNKKRVLEKLASVVSLGGHCLWLDTMWPVHSKKLWRTVGWVTVVRSVGHRVRLLTILERQ